LLIENNKVRVEAETTIANALFGASQVEGIYRLVNTAVSTPATVGYPVLSDSNPCNSGFFNRFKFALDFDTAAIPANWLSHFTFISDGYSAAYYELSHHTVTEFANTVYRSWQIDPNDGTTAFIPMGTSPNLSTIYVNKFPPMETSTFSFTAVALGGTNSPIGVNTAADITGDFLGFDVEEFYTYNTGVGSNISKIIVDGDHNPSTQKLSDGKFFFNATVSVNGTAVYRWLPAKYPTSDSSSDPTEFINLAMPLLSVGDNVTVTVNDNYLLP
jgi:hypothetical protein|tara:strand:- start:6771 stop:7586 length:816 start_codon:yes stop_codon:yes gene_type:complete